MKEVRPDRTKDLFSKDTPASAPSTGSLFERDNLLWMGIGLAVMVLGFVLMSGGGSTDPKVFKPEDVYSTTRITIAPLLILAGLVIEIFAIFRTPKNSQ